MRSRGFDTIPSLKIGKTKGVMDEFDDIIISSPIDPDPIKLDESGEVVVLIKTNDGDLYLKFKGE